MTKAKKTRDEQLLAVAREEGYRNPVIIDGVCCAIHPFYVTWGLVVGIDEYGYQRRYCFEEREAAVQSLGQFKDPRDEHAPGPWIKCKGEFKGQAVDILNSELFIASEGIMKRLQYDETEGKPA